MATITQINLMIANVYLYRGRKTVLIDTGAPDNADRILKALERAGVNPEDLALILLTHAHGDHAGSAGALRERLHIPVAVHRDDAAMLEGGSNGAFVPMDWEAVMSRPFVDRPFPGIHADLLLDSTTDLRALGIDGEILHTPGHSAGSIAIVLDNGEAVVGDLMRGGYLGGTLFPSQPRVPYFMPDLANMPTVYAGVQRVLDAGAQMLYVGHGGPLPRAAVERFLSNKRQSQRIGG